ncbi:serine protease [Colletotrichum abscissum]|uniref:serine protease n=1 Tax=Colletotrichum abscissum TaxID=1671311 RepID=UPI0027D4FC66|nr:serine protease [Colletotrichum abscissum]KAK1475390.1 serine protease [Colletotrichum abscissum]
MKGACIFGIAIASLVAQGAAAPRSQQQQSTAAIPGRWIVTLKSGIDKRDVEQHLDWIHDTHRRTSLSSRAKLASADEDHQAYVYDSSAGTGTLAYVLDSGIRISHPDFQGRAMKGTNVFPEVARDDDFGHGTHVAGTIGSVRFGVAKNATLVDVKTTRVAYLWYDGQDYRGFGVVCTEYHQHSCEGWQVCRQYESRQVVYSFIRTLASDPIQATATSTALNDAVDAATALGVFVVVGAGNDGKDASTRSPASAPTAFTVGAIDINSTRATWSNFGPSVDVFAAGVDVRSTSLYQDGTELLSGTSMSTPHISGLALYLEGQEGSVVDAPAAIGARIKELATKDIVADPGVGSPNLVAYNGNGRR